MKKKTIAFITEELPHGWGFDPASPVRGTDKFYVKTAESYANDFGWDKVEVYLDISTPFKNNGVVYLPRQLFPKSPEFSRVIVCNPRKPVDFDRKQVKNLTLWQNLHMPKDNFIRWCEHIKVEEYDEALCISSFAKKNLPENYAPFFRIVPHGIDHKLYRPDPEAVRKRKIAFTSSPDRGLDIIQSVVDEANLYLADFGHFDITPWELFTTPYGGVSKMNDAEVATNLKECIFWTHPGVGNELFCLAAAEAQAAGCIPVIVPTGALKDTVKWGVRAANVNDFKVILFNLLTTFESPQSLYFSDITADHIPLWRDTVIYIEHSHLDIVL